MLNKYRHEINDVDEQIIKLIDIRFDITNKIGKYKRDNNIEIESLKREEQITNYIKSLNLKSEEEILKIYKSIFKLSKEQQNG